MDGAYNSERTEIELLGRRKIYTDADVITSDNVIPILQEALSVHEQNAAEITFLLRYEKGLQPLKRKKVVRKDIDINVVDNIANQVVEFKLGYNWGNPITFVQRGNKDITGNPPESDDNAISALNEMNDAEAAFAKDQELARFVEIAGIRWSM